MVNFIVVVRLASKLLYHSMDRGRSEL